MTRRVKVPLAGKLLLLAAGWRMLPPVPAMAAESAQVAASDTRAKADLSGDWQGTLQTAKTLRLVLRITKADKGWTAKFYSIDQGGMPVNVPNVTVDGQTVKFAADLIGGTYEGKLDADGTTMVGTWTQGAPLPLTLVRATRETAWEVPAAPPPPKMMAPDADPSFDVATIKPDASGATSMQALFQNGRNFSTRASSLVDLISFAYEVQKKQIVGGPDWMDKDRYDLAAVQDAEGAPNPAQLRSMVKKLIADRFKLTFHQDKRELSAYVLTVGKGGSKLKPTELKGPLPGFGLRPQASGLLIPVRNATVGDFAGFLQSLVLDRPVVDQTRLSGRFDFVLTFTPDDSQFNGHPPPQPAKTDATELAPSLFDAIQQQLGLKLDPQKTQVEVIAIDHVEKPSPN